MDSGKTIVSEGLELSEEEQDVKDPAKGNLPYVFLDIIFTDKTNTAVPCIISSIDARSVSLSDFSLRWALLMLVGSRDKTLESLTLRADDMVFSFDVASDIYISSMGSSCSLSLTQP